MVISGKRWGGDTCMHSFALTGIYSMKYIMHRFWHRCEPTNDEIYGGGGTEVTMTGKNMIVTTIHAYKL